MEIKKNKNQMKSYYIPLLIILAIIAVIVGISTSVKEARQKTPAETPAERIDIPVVATPYSEAESADRPIIPEADSEKVDGEADVTSENESADAAEEAESEPAAVDPKNVIPTFDPPVGGMVIKEFSDTVPVFSDTMNDYRVHTGVDVSADIGDAVFAAADGTVGAVWTDPLMGNCVSIIHSGEMVTTYKGLSENVPEGIAQGVDVYCGQFIGSVGESALIEIAEEPHVHFEMTKSGVPVDPSEYITFPTFEYFND